MKFDERFLDELKSRLRLSDVIGRTVKLRRQGREYVGLSPFSKEKSPSFFVNDDKGFFHDFSSGKHGDLIGFLQETERLTFREAVERLAAEAGLSLPTEDPRSAEQERVRQTLQDWLELATKWFEGELGRPAGASARRYLEGRGLPKDQWARFGLGFAPAGRTGLKDYLVAKGARPAELIEAGLLIAPEDGSAPYDRFRDRIIFPITDGRGRVISFGGRAMDPEARAKYLNGPDSPLFHKGQVLYGLSEARKLLHAGSTAGGEATLVVVEGYMDVIACQRAGVAAVAPLGTALTEEQMSVLWRLHPEPTLCFDGDAAGARAAWRSMDRALPLLQPGRSFRFALPTGAKDPDEVLREQGAAALKSQLADTRPFVAMLFDREREQAGALDTPEVRTALKVTLRKLAATIADQDLARAYRDDLLQRFEALWTLSKPAATYDDAARVFRKGRFEKRKAPLTGASPLAREAARTLANAPTPLTAAIAVGLINDPDLLDEKLGSLETQGFWDTKLETIAQAILHIRLHAGALDAGVIRRHFASTDHASLLEEMSKAAARSHAPFLTPDMPLQRARALWSQAVEVLVQIAALERALDAEKHEAEPDFAVLRQLKSERDALRRDIGSGAVWNDGARDAEAFTRH